MTKTLRRNNPEYQALKELKLGYKNSMKNLFSQNKDWKKLSRALGINNVPTSIEDRLKLQAELSKTLKN